MERESINAGVKRFVLMALLAVALILIAVALGRARTTQQPVEQTIDEAMQAEVIDSISAALNEVYVFPDVAGEMEGHIRKKFKKTDADFQCIKTRYGFGYQWLCE